MPTSRKKKHQHLVALGAQVRLLRVAGGWSQEGFADHVEMERTYYGDIERGTRNVSALNLIRLAEGFGVGVGDLFPASVYRRRR